ncbi:hypothetical protein D0B54_18475 [Solimonas sp. K1W22B-7]|uniref:hypothetical protein n=1 Tax=Solimonas sp. K1W22B-7 TaxID=2303331 RepID=UPI000E331964|nr:hypothetical protein [Solimonas sp. K1W22B-7]AXQ30546.1 hypothetical protein D0B54_18475 [Solimonas sp. K1W22B-7]
MNRDAINALLILGALGAMAVAYWLLDTHSVQVRSFFVIVTMALLRQLFRGLWQDPVAEAKPRTRIQPQVGAVRQAPSLDKQRES